MRPASTAGGPRAGRRRQGVPRRPAGAGARRRDLRRGGRRAGGRRRAVRVRQVHAAPPDRGRSTGPTSGTVRIAGADVARCPTASCPALLRPADRVRVPAVPPARRAHAAGQRGRRAGLPRHRAAPSGGRSRRSSGSGSATGCGHRPPQLSGGERQRVAIARARGRRAGDRAGRRADRQPRLGAPAPRSSTCSGPAPRRAHDRGHHPRPAVAAALPTARSAARRPSSTTRGAWRPRPRRSPAPPRRARPRRLAGATADLLRSAPRPAGQADARALTALGIAIGIAAMVAVVGISASSRADLLAELDELGTNLLRSSRANSCSATRSQLPTTPAMIRRIGPVESAAGRHRRRRHRAAQPT